eukprot:2624238-Alexandrium_andersonii.AAC.1
MSASLVGSEMCIRDSSPGGCRDGVVGGDPPRAARRLRGRSARPGADGRLCLLYTSDAADDM